MCFGGEFHLILMHFFFLYSMLWGKFSKIQFFFSLKICFFQNFDWSNLIFDQSKSCFKNSVSLYLIRLIEPVFQSIEHRVLGFFLKTVLWLFQTSFSKVFQLFLSLSDLARLHSNFFSFSSSIFARFFSLKADKTILSLFLVLFSCFHAFFHAFKGYFRISLNLGFLLIQGYFSEIDHWVLLVYCYIHDFCWLIWSIWGFMKNWKF